MPVLKLLVKATLRQLQRGREKGRHRWLAGPPSCYNPHAVVIWNVFPRAWWALGGTGPCRVLVSRRLWWEIEASRLSAHVPKVQF